MKTSQERLVRLAYRNYWGRRYARSRAASTPFGTPQLGWNLNSACLPGAWTKSRNKLSTTHTLHPECGRATSTPSLRPWLIGIRVKQLLSVDLVIRNHLLP